MLTVAGASYLWRERFIKRFKNQLRKTVKILFSLYVLEIQITYRISHKMVEI